MPRTGSRRAWVAIALVLAALVATACGSRLPDDVLAEIDANALGAGDSGSVGADDGAGVGSDGGDGASADGDGGATGDGASSGGGGSSGSGGGAAPAGDGGASCSGGATATGVTADEIKVAAMVTASGPLPGATEGNYRGAAAYFAKVNAEGGVCGRKITILKGDDGLDPQRARSEFLRLEPQVFAFVGSLAVADSGYVDLVGTTKVPYVGTFVDPAGRDHPNTVPHAEPGVGNTGQYLYYKQKHPEISKVGFLYADVGGVRSNTPGAVAGWEKSGFSVVRNSGLRATDPDYSSEVIALRRAGTQLLYLFAFEVNMHVRLARNMRQQNFEPPLKVANIGYNSKLTELLGPIANGWSNQITYLPMLNPDEPARSPALAEFLKWNKQLFPTGSIDLFPVNGWAAAAQFVAGLKAAGGDLTRPKIVTAIDTLPESDGGGMTATVFPKQRRGSGCFIIVRVDDGKWVREHPKTGYECGIGERYTF